MTDWLLFLVHNEILMNYIWCRSWPSPWELRRDFICMMYSIKSQCKWLKLRVCYVKTYSNRIRLVKQVRSPTWSRNALYLCILNCSGELVNIKISKWSNYLLNWKNLSELDIYGSGIPLFLMLRLLNCDYHLIFSRSRKSKPVRWACSCRIARDGCISSWGSVILLNENWRRNLVLIVKITAHVVQRLIELCGWYKILERKRCIHLKDWHWRWAISGSCVFTLSNIQIS
jgi:hypothetical protein